MSGGKGGGSGAEAVPAFFGVLFAVIAWFPQFSVVRAIVTVPLFSQIVAFPVVTGLVLLLISVLWVVLSPRVKEGNRIALSLTAWVAVLTLILAGIGFIALPVGPPGLTARPEPAAPTGLTRTVRVMTWDTQDHLDQGELATLLREQAPDVLVLTEAEADDVKLLAADFQVLQSPADGPTAPTTVAVRKSLGEYRAVAGPRTEHGTVALVPVTDTTLPRIIGVHCAPLGPAQAGAWRRDLDAVVGALESAPGSTILAGNLNATLRHGGLADRHRTVDAVQVAGRERAGTWPRTMPGWAGSQVDHILVTGPVKVEDAQVLDLGVSNHRAVLATLVLPGAPKGKPAAPTTGPGATPRPTASAGATRP